METPKERLVYVDNLRLFVIACVVMHHLAVTYSGFGGFYYFETRPMGLASTLWFGLYLSFQQAYFMGLLFLIAGYFTAGSGEKRGLGSFALERARRLLLPALAYMALIVPFIELVLLRRKWQGFSLGGFLSSSGVMWFTIALFVFSLVYALARLARRGRAAGTWRLEPTPATASALISIIAAGAFLVRLVQPIGTSVLNMQLGYFSSYIVLFSAGILARRGGLFASLSPRSGKRWLLAGLVLSPLLWIVLAVSAEASGRREAIFGGPGWLSAAYSTWEAFTAVAMSLGLISLFRERFDRQGPLVRALSDNAFTVYMFHPPILTAVCLLLQPLELPSFAKWLLLCAICLPLCFALAAFVIRRIPLLQKIL